MLCCTLYLISLPCISHCVSYFIIYLQTFFIHGWNVIQQSCIYSTKVYFTIDTFIFLLLTCICACEIDICVRYMIYCNILMQPTRMYITVQSLGQSGLVLVLSLVIDWCVYHVWDYHEMCMITPVNFTDPTAVGQAETEVVNAGIVAGVVCTIVFILLAVLGFIGCR